MDHNRLVIRSCHVGMFVQAMVINIAPLLFIPLKSEMGLTFEQIGRLVLINFFTQMVVDLLCCWLADRMNVKLLTVLANVFSAAGLWLFAFSPAWFSHPYYGLVLGTVVSSIGCGLLEVLLSPIINAVTHDRKASAMAILHAFYPIGKIAVILVTGAVLYIWGTAHWRGIMVAWSVVPLANSLTLLAAKLPPFSKEGQRQPLRELVRIPAYLLIVAAMAFAGATEVTMAQWASAFAEKGLGLSKVVADIVAFGLFGTGMVIGRVWFGKKGETSDLVRVMTQGAGVSALMYIVMSLAPWPAVSLLACGVAGVSVSLLWPGIVTLGAARFPLAGGSMFALLAASGDMGCGAAPWWMGWVADHVRAVPSWLEGHVTVEQLGLRVGLLVAAVGPLILLRLVRAMKD